MNKAKTSDSQQNDAGIVGVATFWKAIATLGMWVFVTGGLALIGVFLAPVMGEDALGAVFMLLGAAVVISGFIWNWGQIPGQQSDKKQSRAERRTERREKRSDNVDDEYYDLYYGAQVGTKNKNEGDRLAAALKQLSDDELVILRERIASGEIREDDLESVLLDDKY